MDPERTPSPRGPASTDETAVARRSTPTSAGGARDPIRDRKECVDDGDRDDQNRQRLRAVHGAWLGDFAGNVLFLRGQLGRARHVLSCVPVPLLPRGRHATATARRASTLQAAALLVVDPFDEETNRMWRERFGFRPSSEKGALKRLWLPLDLSD